MPPKKAVKEPKEEIDPGPVKIEFFPLPLLAELQRRRAENEYSPHDPPTIGSFLDQLLADPDSDYNCCKIWSGRLVRRMSQLMQRSVCFPDAHRHEYAILLLLNLMAEFVRNVSVSGVVVRLDDFAGYLSRMQAPMWRDFETMEWICLLSVLERPQRTGSGTSKRTIGRNLAAVASHPESSSRLSGSGAASQASSQMAARSRFTQQLDALVAMLRRCFPYNCHFEMFVQMARTERHWLEIGAVDHRLHLARPLLGGKESKKKAPPPKPPAPTPAAADDGAAIEADVELSPEELLLLEQRQFILPLALATDMGNNFWEMMFGKV